MGTWELGAFLIVTSLSNGFKFNYTNWPISVLWVISYKIDQSPHPRLNRAFSMLSTVQTSVSYMTFPSVVIQQSSSCYFMYYYVVYSHCACMYIVLVKFFSCNILRFTAPILHQIILFLGKNKDNTLVLEGKLLKSSQYIWRIHLFLILQATSCAARLWLEVRSFWPMHIVWNIIPR